MIDCCSNPDTVGGGTPIVTNPMAIPRALCTYAVISAGLSDGRDSFLSLSSSTMRACAAKTASICMTTRKT